MTATLDLRFSWSTDLPDEEGFYFVSIGGTAEYASQVFHVFDSLGSGLCVETDDGCWIRVQDAREALGFAYWSPRLAVHATPPERERRRAEGGEKT